MSRTINKIFESATTQQDFKRGDIYYIERTGQETGCEQRAGRPAVIVSNDTGNRHGETIMVVYLTTQPKADLPTHTTIYSTARASTVLCENVETVSKLRVGGYRGRATPDEMRDIDEALAVALALKLPETQQDTPQTTAEAQKLKEAEEQIDTAEKAQREAEEAARTAKRETAFYKQLYEETLEKCRKLACGGGDGVTLSGTREETDNAIEMMALAGACDICPGAQECTVHRDPAPDEWEKLSCGEVIRHHVKINIVEG